MAFVLVVRMRAQEGKEEEAAGVMKELADATRREPGCIYYIPVQSNEDPRDFIFYEQYRDEAAFAEHGASEHFERLAAGRLFGLLESRERTFYTTVE